MATLAGNTIASTYPLLLKIDSSGIDGTLRAVEDGDGTDSALSIATDSVLVKGDGIKLYFYDADGGEHISADASGDLTIAAGTALNITADIIDLSDATKDITLNAAVDALNFDSNTLSIDASNNRVGIGTAAPASNLHILHTDADADAGPIVTLQRDNSAGEDNGDILGEIKFQGSDSANTITTEYSTIHSLISNVSNTVEEGTLVFKNMVAGTSTPVMNIAGNKVLIGHTNSNNVRGIDPRVQIAGTDQPTSGLTLTRYQAGAFGPGIHFAKSRNASLGGHTIVSDGDRIGDITWYASDGTDFANNCAAIMVNIDGSPGANNTPGRLTFHTAASGSGSASERMRISQDGAIRLGGTAKSSLSILGGTAGSGAFRFSSGTNNENLHIEYYENDIGGIAFSEVIDTGGSQTWNKYNAAGAVIQTVTQAGLVVLQQGANDGSILEFRSSDVAHGMTDQYPTDTYGAFNKSSNNDGGLRMEGYSEAKIGLQFDGISSTDNTDRATTASGNISLRAWKKSNNSWDTIESDGNLLTVGNGNAVRFIIDEDGDVHADNSINATAFDTYNDAQLVRAFDLSHGKNLIQSKFDEFIDYNHEKLAELKLVGREADGTPNHFMNVTGMQRLHNGAIWQQYTEMQKMKELMYDAMVELMGKEKADKKLKNHDVSLLDNKDSLN